MKLHRHTKKETCTWKKNYKFNIQLKIEIIERKRRETYQKQTDFNHKPH